MDAFLATLTELPPSLLYSALALFAAIENVIPPFPADVAFAFGAYVAARAGRGMTVVFLAAWLGNVLGGIGVYAAARRYGSERFERLISGRKAERRSGQFNAMHLRYGIAALFLARFVPGVRALVPAAAGALQLSPVSTALMLMAASALWYGGIVFIVFRMEEWAQVEGALSSGALVTGIVAAVVLGGGIIAWLIVRRRRAH